jgi:quinol monooxygenase YgiN/heme-degrading monooxygenase HmoA
MHARSTNIKGNPTKLDAGIAYVHDEVLPATQRTEGCVGLSMLTDRESGRCIVATAWVDEQVMRSTAEEDRTVRHRLLHTLGGGHADVQEWEIAILHRGRPAGDGAGAQVTWARIAPNHLDDLLDAYRYNLMPKLQELPGFCSVSMLVDRRTGRTVSVTSFESREAAALMRKHARSLREQFAQAMGAKILDLAEMDLVLAHLRVPETV